MCACGEGEKGRGDDGCGQLSGPDHSGVNTSVAVH